MRKKQWLRNLNRFELLRLLINHGDVLFVNGIAVNNDCLKNL